MNLTDFVVGRGDDAMTIHCEILTVQETPNIVLVTKNTATTDPAAMPPLNINGLRRLSRHLSALADLLEHSKPSKVPPAKETMDALVDRVLARRRKEKA